MRASRDSDILVAGVGGLGGRTVLEVGPDGGCPGPGVGAGKNATEGVVGVAGPGDEPGQVGKAGEGVGQGGAGLEGELGEEVPVFVQGMGDDPVGGDLGLRPGPVLGMGAGLG